MSCLNLYEYAFDEWGDILLKPLNGGRYPLAGEFELTNRCNLTCRHCYINQPAGSLEARKIELSTSEVKDILDQISAAGCLHLLLTGGEPLLRADFLEIYLHARRKGMLVMLFTNATMLTPEIVSELQKAPPVLIEVSVYGATKQTYETVTGVPGSYERFINGLQLLKESGLPVATKSVLLSLNRHELPLMQKLAEDMGLRYRYDGSMWPRFDGSEKPFNYRLGIEEMMELDDTDPVRMQDWVDSYTHSKNLPMRSDKYVFSCGAGHRSFHIDSSGNLNACMMVRRPSFNILKMGFEAAWEKLGEFRSMERTRKVPCLTCSASGMCMQCPGWSQMVHGDNETIVDFICEITKTREQKICYTIDILEEKLSYE